MGLWNRFNIELTERRIAIVAREIMRCDLRSGVGFKYLRLKYERLQDQLDRRRHRELVEFCRAHGCDMQSVGGANAGCSDGDVCSCSIPVMKCVRCGDCDYGENDEADEVRRCCAEGLPHPMGSPYIMRHSAKAFG